MKGYKKIVISEEWIDKALEIAERLEQEISKLPPKVRSEVTIKTSAFSLIGYVQSLESFRRKDKR